MAIRVQTQRPKGLLASLRSAIRAGSLDSWEVDDDGDLTLTQVQWRSKAWMRPRVSDGRLTFNIIAPLNTALSTRAYAVFHARLVQTLLEDFDAQFERVSASAGAESLDLVAGSHADSDE
jgi:hypothetical protein